MTKEFDFESIREKYGICSLVEKNQRCECLKKHYSEMMSCKNWNPATSTNYSELAEWQDKTFKKN